MQTESEKNRLYYEKNKERLLASKHARSTTEQRAIRNSRRRAVTVEKRKQRIEGQQEIDEKFKAAFTVAENIARTRLWWGQP